MAKHNKPPFPIYTPTKTYAKKALSVDAQIELLRTRGLLYSDEERARRYLRHINYYRLRAYWMPFELPTGNAPANSDGSALHAFQPNVHFNDILNFYLFDRKFRLLVMEAIERFEISIRTMFAHHLALTYGPHGALDAALYTDRAKHQKTLKELKDELDRSQEVFIQHYLSTYKTPELPPIWVLSEIMTFGQLSTCFKNLKRPSDRNRISRGLQIDERTLTSFMHHLNIVRNLTAHHCRLWNRRFVVTMKIPTAAGVPADVANSFNRDQHAVRYIYNTLVMLVYLLRIISPKTTWPDRLVTLINEYVKDNVSLMGFPANWCALPIWKDISPPPQ